MMLFHGENPILRIEGVEQMRWSGGRYRVEPRSYCALALRLSGEAVIDCGKERFTVTRENLLYLPQNLGYRAEYTDTDLLVIHFTTLKSDPKPEIYHPENMEKLKRLFLSAYQKWKNKEPGYGIFPMKYLYEILCELSEGETKNVLPPHFLKALSFIHENFRDSGMNLYRICTQAGISGTALRQLFRRYYQKTPLNYITDLRLEYARALISEGISVETAALDSGFNDSKYFARVVKKHLNCTPRELRSFGQ